MNVCRAVQHPFLQAARGGEAMVKLNEEAKRHARAAIELPF
jgi:hypothetical protein